MLELDEIEPRDGTINRDAVISKDASDNEDATDYKEQNGNTIEDDTLTIRFKYPLADSSNILDTSDENKNSFNEKSQRPNPRRGLTHHRKFYRFKNVKGSLRKSR